MKNDNVRKQTLEALMGAGIEPHTVVEASLNPLYYETFVTDLEGRRVRSRWQEYNAEEGRIVTKSEFLKRKHVWPDADTGREIYAVFMSEGGPR